ncbi:DUF3329 domain-containing protein [Morganella morganii]|uniref:DUF3329 domain-containing protein n=1 Tax=Morganella morganii TaxID=582 RepID=UPI003EBA3F82
MSNKIKKENIYSIVIMLSTFILVFLLNFLTMYTSDDYTYRYVYQPMPSDSMVKIDGFISIIESQINHYKIWNGRFVAHSIVQYFMQFDKTIFNIFNSVAFVFLGVIIIKIVKNEVEIRNEPLSLFLTYIFLWFIIPEFGTSVLWISGSGNYLWTSIIYLSFLFLILKKSKLSFVSVVFYSLIGFLSGATNENSAPAITLISSIFTIYFYMKDREIKINNITGIVFSVIGFLCMMMSPGTIRRGSVDITYDFLLNNIIRAIKVDAYLFTVAYVIIIATIFIAVRANKLNKDSFVFILIMVIGHFSAIYSMIFSPEMPLRSCFGAATFLVIIEIFIINKINFDKRSLTLRIILSSAFIASYSYAANDIKNTYNEVSNQISILSGSRVDDDVFLPMLSKPKSSYNAYWGTSNLTEDKNSWFNSWMASYYGVKSITGTQ